MVVKVFKVVKDFKDFLLPLRLRRLDRLRLGKAQINLAFLSACTIFAL